MGGGVSPSVLIGSSIAYLLLIKMLSSFMASREPFKCREIMIAYNIVQIVLCGYMTFGISSLLMNEAPIWEPVEGTSNMAPIVSTSL